MKKVVINALDAENLTTGEKIPIPMIGVGKVDDVMVDGVSVVDENRVANVNCLQKGKTYNWDEAPKFEEDTDYFTNTSILGSRSFGITHESKQDLSSTKALLHPGELVIDQIDDSGRKATEVSPDKIEFINGENSKEFGIDSVTKLDSLPDVQQLMNLFSTRIRKGEECSDTDAPYFVEDTEFVTRQASTNPRSFGVTAEDKTSGVKTEGIITPRGTVEVAKKDGAENKRTVVSVEGITMTDGDNTKTLNINSMMKLDDIEGVVTELVKTCQYRVGDSFTIGSQNAVFSGYITSSLKSIYFYIPTPKPIATGSKAIVTGSVGVRSSQNIVNGAAIDLSNYTVSTRVTNFGITVVVQSQTAFTDAINNTVVAVSPSAGGLNVQFTE